MSPTLSRWVAKHTLAEHLKVPPRLLGIMEDGVGDRPGKAPGPQRLELFRNVPNDWRETRVDVNEINIKLLGNYKLIGEFQLLGND